jgi:pentatricopeptide repeat protein
MPNKLNVQNNTLIKHATVYLFLFIEFLPNKFLYTSLMQTYVNNNNPNMTLKILNEMIEKGLNPDLATYTTLINSFRKGRKLEKCWEVHKKMK